MKERTRDLAQSINELKVLEEVGRAVASSLDLNAVLPTVAARALEITHADAVLIYGYDAETSVQPDESIGIDKSAEGSHLAIDEDGSALGEAAAQGEPIAIADLAPRRTIPCATSRSPPASIRCWSCRWSTSRACWVRWWCCARRPASSRQNLIGLMKTFAHQSVLAMRNARLFSEVDPKSRELETAHSTVQQQADKLQEQTDQLKNWNSRWRSASRPSSPRSSASAGSNVSSRRRSRS